MTVRPVRLVLGPLVAGTQPFGDGTDPYPDAALTGLTGPWARAVWEAVGSSADLDEAVAAELASLWHDLEAARRCAQDGSWSVACDDLVTRIVVLTRLSAVTPWQQVQATLLTDGIWQGILTAAGIPFDPPDMGVVRDLHERIRSGTVRVYAPPPG